MDHIIAQLAEAHAALGGGYLCVTRDAGGLYVVAHDAGDILRGAGATTGEWYGSGVDDDPLQQREVTLEGLGWQIVCYETRSLPTTQPADAGQE